MELENAAVSAGKTLGLLCLNGPDAYILEKDRMTEQELAMKAAGERLKAMRERAGLSQEALALNINYDQSSLSKVERVGPHKVSWSKLFAIAEKLGCVVEVNFRPREQAR